MKRLTSLALLLALLCTLLGGCIELDDHEFAYDSQSETEESFFGSESVGGSDEHAELTDGIPAYSGKKYVTVNGNVPYFTKDTATAETYEFYSELDSLGRCGCAVACIGIETMPTGERGEIGHVYPSGWVQARYDTNLVDGGYLYNRSHLIGWQLSAEDDNEKNLITGTRYFNVQGMLPFENMVADYIKETQNHVMYRVTPMFLENELVCRGVLMEAYSVEDEGDGITFCVFVYNVQPGITIDYRTGKSALGSSLEIESEAASETGKESGVTVYVLNVNTKKFHEPDCSSVSDIKPSNRQDYTGERQALIEEGYQPCKSCNP